MEIKKLKFGIVGGTNGLGSWFVKFLENEGITTYFTGRRNPGNVADNRELVAKSDVIILSVPISGFEAALEEIVPLCDGKILMDVCSVKGFVIRKVEALRASNPGLNFSFYSLHPMYSQRVKNPEGHVIIRNHEIDPVAGFYEAFRAMFTQYGMVFRDMDYDAHDRLMGVVQCLNHFNVFVSAATLRRLTDDLDGVKALSSPTYRIFLVFFTRYVLQNPGLYADIQLFNDYSESVLQTFADESQKLLTIIRNKDRQKFVDYVEEMQGFFEQNTGDSAVSDRLIRELGRSLAEGRKESSESVKPKAEKSV